MLEQKCLQQVQCFYIHCLYVIDHSVTNMNPEFSTRKRLHPTWNINEQKGANKIFKSSTRKNFVSANLNSLKSPRCSNFRRASSFVVPCSNSDSYRSSEFSFPSMEECLNRPIPKRRVEIPVAFDSVTSYKQIFKSALMEHLNIIIFDVAVKYYTALNLADISAINENVINNKPGNIPNCKHGPCKMMAVRKEGRNKGRLFYSCSVAGSEQCNNAFAWADELDKKSQNTRNNANTKSGKIILNDNHGVTTHFNARGVQLYCDVKITRKTPFSQRKNKGCSLSPSVNQKKRMFLVLPFKKASRSYSKDDIWIVSKNLEFKKGSIFIAKSVFYGPNSSGELEILPLSCYSMSNWQNNEMCYVIQACNASTELACIDNLDAYVNKVDIPVFSDIISRSPRSGLHNIYGRFNLSCLEYDDMSELIENTNTTFELNEDQLLSLKNIADMFTKENQLSISLIHGVFGAGKSYLLSTVVLFLVQLFELLETRFQLKKKLKLLISSTTNVAVDRVLHGLLDLGFDDFVRVGSVKKIAKRILPYSVHASDHEDQELKELNDLLKSEVTDQERGKFYLTLLLPPFWMFRGGCFWVYLYSNVYCFFIF